MKYEQPWCCQYPYQIYKLTDLLLDSPWFYFFALTLNEGKTITVSVQVLPILCHIKELCWLNKIISSSQFRSANATIFSWQHYLFINYFFFSSPHYFYCRWLIFMAGKCFIAKLGNLALVYSYQGMQVERSSICSLTA